MAEQDQSQRAGVAHLDPFPERIEPMLAMPWPTPFVDPGWINEAKLDGYRLLGHVRDGRARLWSKNGTDYTGEFRDVASELGSQRTDMVVDGEVVALVDGVPSFYALRPSARPPGTRIVYYVFDLLYLNGRDLCRLPLGERRPLMEKNVHEGRSMRLVHAIPDGPRLFDVIVEAGMEGIVAKRLASTYQPGRRSPDWRKVKPFRSAEFIVVGYTKLGNGIGSLVLAYWHYGRLKYAGRVSSGIGTEASKAFRQALDSLATRRPILDAPPHGRFIDPLIVVEVRFTELTPSGCVRHPVFLRVRHDVAPEAVHRPIDPSTAT